MPITIGSFSALQERAERLISAVYSWSIQHVEALAGGGLTYIRVVSLGTHADSFAIESAAIVANGGFAGLSAGLQADVTSIHTEMTGTISPAIVAALNVDDTFTALPSDKQSAIVVALGLPPDESTPLDAWDPLPAEMKRDSLQDIVIAVEHHETIAAAITIAFE